jgi:hypothetical protein
LAPGRIDSPSGLVVGSSGGNGFFSTAVRI